jgi:hypothetical protein
MTRKGCLVTLRPVVNLVPLGFLLPVLCFPSLTGRPGPTKRKIPTKTKSSIKVKFKGNISKGTPEFDDGPNHRKLGTYIGRFGTKGEFLDHSFRFEVTGFVRDGGTIGHIGDRDLQNGGAWTIGQVVNPLVGSNLNGIPSPIAGQIRDDSPEYLASDKKGVVTVAVNGGTFAWRDGPGFVGGETSPVKSASLAANFTVYAKNGTKHCQVGFHILAAFEKGKWTAIIRPGHLL